MLGETHPDQSVLYWWDVTVATEAMAANLSTADTVCSHTDWWLTWFLLRQNERLSFGRFAEQRAYSNGIHLNHCKILWHCINVEDTIVDTPVHHLIVDHSSIIATRILFNSGAKRQTLVMATALFAIIYCSDFCVCFNEHVIFSLTAMRPTQICTLLTCSEGQSAAFLLQIKTVSHDCARAAAPDFLPWATLRDQWGQTARSDTMLTARALPEHDMSAKDAVCHRVHQRRAT